MVAPISQYRFFLPSALELLFPHPPLLLIFSFNWLPLSHKMTNDTWRYLLSTFWQLFWQIFDKFLTTFWQLFDYFLTTFWQLFDNFLKTFFLFWQFVVNFFFFLANFFTILFLFFVTMWYCTTFVTPQVFQFIGPSNDGRMHGRGTYLFRTTLYQM
jgi:hypothetical protein